MRDDDEAFCAAGGRLYTGLRDVTRDLAALDGRGRWAVCAPYEGEPWCARFADVAPAPRWTGGPWSGPRPDDWVTSLDRPAFVRGVHAIRAAIAAGDVYQVNLTRRLSAPLRRPAAGASTSVAALGIALAAGNPAPYQAVLHLPRHGVSVASASPESFLVRDGDEVCSSPIKGTARAPEGLSAKDRAENVMIVDLVRNDLGRVCRPGSVRVPSLLALEHHPGLVHLVSTVCGTLRPDVGWPELFAATFPPGSVTGAPKIAACRFIDELEPVPRGPYCGSIGVVDADRRRGVLNVAIRTFWIEDGHLHFGTGGGITWDSDPDAEWAETELKAANLLRVASSPAGAPSPVAPIRPGGPPR
jgi:para-aminobenzoate synthetase component 1